MLGLGLGVVALLTSLIAKLNYKMIDNCTVSVSNFFMLYNL